MAPKMSAAKKLKVIARRKEPKALIASEITISIILSHTSTDKKHIVQMLRMKGLTTILELIQVYIIVQEYLSGFQIFTLAM